MHHAKISRYMVVVTGNSPYSVCECVCVYIREWNGGMEYWNDLWSQNSTQRVLVYCTGRSTIKIVCFKFLRLL